MNDRESFKNYIDWVRDAHAMEEQAETMLKKMADRLEHYPLLQQRIVQHISETQNQQRLVRSVLERLDESNSVLKDTAAKISAFGQGIGGLFASDEVVKGGLAGYVFEHMEIASYSALIAAAEYVGDLEGATVFRQIKAQEEEMAAWLQENLPAVTHEFLRRSDNPDLEAKR